MIWLLGDPWSRVSFRKGCVPLPHIRTSLLASETMQALRKPDSLGTKEDTGSRFFQVKSVESEGACPNT